MRLDMIELLLIGGDYVVQRACLCRVELVGARAAGEVSAIRFWPLLATG